MDREELIKRIKEENEAYDSPYETEVENKALKAGVVFAFLFGIFLAVLRWILQKEYSSDLLAVLWVIPTVICTIKAIKFPKPSHIIMAAIFVVILLGISTMHILFFMWW